MTAAEVVRAMYDAFARGDFATAMEFVAEDVVWDPGIPDHDVSQGKPALNAFFRRWLGTWSDYRFTVEEITDLGGGRVATVFHERGTGRGSGIVVDELLRGVHEVRDGKVVSWKREA